LKYVILVIVVILFAPTVGKRLTQGQAPPRRRGLYRLISRYGLRNLTLAVVVLLIALSVAVSLLA